MIGMLSGRLAERGQEHVLIDVGGVGYVVHVSDRTLAGLPGVGEAARLYTELLVREDLLQLFGFLTPAEREWHRLLISVQGVGSRASMAILGTLGPDAVERAIALGDWAAVKAAPGIGPKIAQRVVHELKGKAPAAAAFTTVAPRAAGPDPAGGTAPAPASAPADAARADALSALANLGYAPADAHRGVAEAVDEAPEADTGTLIRLALRRLAPSG